MSLCEKELAGGAEVAHTRCATAVYSAHGRPVRDFSEQGLSAQRLYDFETEHRANLDTAFKVTPSWDHDEEQPSRGHPDQFSMREDAMPTPSDMLLAALPLEAQKMFAHPRDHTIDLSHVDSHKWENVKSSQRTPGGFRAMPEAILSRFSQEDFSSEMFLSAILARHMSQDFITSSQAVSGLYEAKTIHCLHSRGYSMDDVLAWTSILKTSDTNQMVSKFIETADDHQSSDRLPLPTFLLMFILRANTMSGTSIRLLVKYISKHYVGAFTSSGSLPTTLADDGKTAMIMTVRLIRHARVVWPSGLEILAVIATKLITPESDRIENLSRKLTQCYSHYYNRLLTLFSLPTSIRPLVSVTFQQRSQFCLVRKMTDFKPHLPISREGFRALVKVQLAHKKTEAERKWASSKALSWPPWKEELLGIEADSEDCGKNSRAADVLLQMTEAGYSHRDWERTARLLAGWDTDGSPTIQTRTLLKQPPILRSADVKREDIYHFMGRRMWPARIVATRTIKEAWACFISYDKSARDFRDPGPYHAMFRKLLRNRPQDGDQKNEATLVTPGDAIETWPEPTSPHDFLHVPSDPPTIDEFFALMMRRGLEIGSHLLADLLDSVETLAEGMKYIMAARLNKKAKDVLLGSTRTEDANYICKVMGTVDNHVIAAYVRLLCRVEAMAGIQFTLPNLSDLPGRSVKKAQTRDPFHYAQSFVPALQSSHRPIWYAIFLGLGRRTSRPESLYQSWSRLLDQLRAMDALQLELEFSAFADIAKILEEVLLTNIFVLLSQEQEVFCNLRSECVLLCKSLFNAMAYGGPVLTKYKTIAQSDCWLPLHHHSSAQDRSHLLSIPTPFVLQQTIRILGMNEDNASILNLLRWMHCLAPELKSVADELANSKKLTRLAITAARYSVEKAWRTDDFEQLATLQDKDPGQIELVSDLKAIVEQHEDDWGGWPTDEELYDYHQANKSKARRLRATIGPSESREK